MNEEITIKQCKCLRCGYIWYPRSSNLPKMCTKCKSYKWMEKKGDTNE